VSPKPRRVPHVLVAATVSRNPKLAALPSDTARLGYFYAVLGEAKLLRPCGRFASRGQWLEVAGRFARFLPQYLAQGLIEQAPALCKKCSPRWGELPPGTLVVHDWHEHQTDPGAAERARDWRGDHTNGAGPEPEREDEPPFDERSLPVQSAFDERSISVQSAFNEQDTRARRDARSRAAREVERRTKNVEGDSSSTSGGNARAPRTDDADPAFPLRQWLAAHSAPVRDGDGYHAKLVRLIATDTGKTCEDVIAAFERLARDGARTSKQYVMGAEDLLFPVPKAGTSKAPAVPSGKYDALVESGDAPVAEPDWIGGGDS
jgi:hypothetical protein